MKCVNPAKLNYLEDKEKDNLEMSDNLIQDKEIFLRVISLGQLERVVLIDNIRMDMSKYLLKLKDIKIFIHIKRIIKGITITKTLSEPE